MVRLKVPQSAHRPSGFPILALALGLLAGPFSDPVASAQGGSPPTSTVSSGGICHFVNHENNVRCQAAQFSVTAASVGEPRNGTVILLIDGKGPTEFGYDFIRKGQNVPIAPGLHTITVNFYESRATLSAWAFVPGAGPTIKTRSSPENHAVTFEAVAGHSYEVSSLMITKDTWRPIVGDVTDRKHWSIVSAMPTNGVPAN